MTFRLGKTVHFLLCLELLGLCLCNYSQICMDIKPSNENVSLLRKSSNIMQYRSWWLLETTYRGIVQSVQYNNNNYISISADCGLLGTEIHIL